LDTELRRSVMVTSEIPVRPIEAGDRPEAIRAVYLEAGRDLAAINQIGVEGFGWIARDGAPWPLQGEHAG
jgi:hypothetical protein